jgi:hypothetical protein
MGAIAIGPLIVAPHYFVAVLAAALFIASSWFLALTVDDKLYRVTMSSLASFVVAARIGHVLQYLPNFLSDPLRTFAFWQGGFHWPAVLFGLIVVNFIYLRNTGLLAWSAVPVALAGVTAAAALAFSADTSATPLPLGRFTTLDGRSITPDHLKGRRLVINLWASWCPPCRRELPMMAEFAHTDHGAEFVFVDQDEDKSVIERFLKKRQ